MSRYQVTTLFGRPFLTDPDDTLDLLKWGTYEPDESALIRGVLDKKSFALDIGAHIGYYTSLMLDTGARVAAFEPNPLNYAFLSYNCKGDASLYKTALSDHYGEIDMHLSPVNSGDDTLYPFDDSDRVKVKVHCAELDTIDLLGEPTFIKMDIQGGEYRALLGMNETLSRGKVKHMAIEFYPEALRAADSDPAEMLRFLWNHGFALYEVHEGHGTMDGINIGILSRPDMQNGYINLWCVR